MPADLYKMHLVCVDPGLRGCGAAWFRDGVLRQAAYVKNPLERDRGPVVHAEMSLAVSEWWTNIITSYGIGSAERCFYVEFPVIYGQAQQKKGGSASDNDVLDVAGVASSCMARFSRFEERRFFLPRDWKGTIDPDVMTRRIVSALTESERLVIKSVGSKDHNTIDAVGIGLAALARLNRKVFA